MPPSSSPPLTLIVAATSHLGIGHSGALPWRLRTEMAYFARVTKGIHPVPSPTSTSNTTTPSIPHANAVIMGRKTWTSIPSRFRPLDSRINIVVTRQGIPQTGDNIWGPYPVSNLDAAIKLASGELEGKAVVERIFVIGGTEIYKLAMAHPGTKRVLMTEVRKLDIEGEGGGEGSEEGADADADGFECDTFFPEFRGEGMGWKRKGQEELSAFVGEEVPAGWQTEKGLKFEYQLWEKE